MLPEVQYTISQKNQREAIHLGICHVAFLLLPGTFNVFLNTSLWPATAWNGESKCCVGFSSCCVWCLLILLALSLAKPGACTEMRRLCSLESCQPHGEIICL